MRHHRTRIAIGTMAHIAKLAREAALLAGLVTSLVPQGAARRIDEPSPGDCPF